MAVDLGIITKSGAFFSYNDIRLGQGRENARAFLDETPELMEEIENRVRTHNTDVPILNAAAVVEEE